MRHGLMKRWGVGAWALAFLLLGLPVFAAENLIKNPSFEEGRDGRVARWAEQTWGGQATLSVAEAGHTGKRSVKIESKEGADASWAQRLEVEPGAKIRVSAWVKTEGVELKGGRGVLLNIHGMNGAETQPLKGTNDWTQMQMEVTTGDEEEIMVNCLFGGFGLATGQAWFDDVTVEVLEAGKAQESLAQLKPAVSIDAAKTGEPISKYVYGQFIEHLGECIYGGTWAEMLVDRKFYYPVTGDASKAWGKTREEARILVASPWAIVGPAEAVKMQKEKIYVTDQQAPELTLPGGKPAGLSQNALGLVQGKAYVGRVILAGDASAAPVEVSLIWGEGPNDRETVKIDALTAEYAKYPVKFKAGAASENGRFEIVSKGTGKLWIATASLMPGDNIKGWRKDTVEMLKKLNSPVYRWPGGNFVSGYNWRDGIGETDRRPTRKNPAWTGLEYNDVGIHEFMDLCDILGTEPYIAVNTGLGTVEETAQEVEYVNGSVDTPLGKLRAENGHPEPYKCKWWGVGNEMFGNWQLGHMPQKDYIIKHNKVADAMWAMDKSITLIGVGNAGDGWTKNMFAGSADKMDIISEHIYFQQKRNVPAHVNLAVSAIKAIADTHRKLRAEMPELKDKKIPIALDEWNYWYGPHVFGELGTRYFLKDGLGIAAGLHEIYRNSDLYFMANYAQTVNVIGCIKTTKTAAELETTGLVLELYRAQYGVTPVTITGTPKPLDVVAAWTADKKALTVAVVNPASVAYDLKMDVAGAKLSGKGKAWTIAGDDPMAYNDPGQPRKIDIVEKAVEGAKTSLKIEPLSVIVFRLDVE